MPAATATNLQAALTTGVSKLAATSLTAASAMAAAHDFFDVGAGQPPQRVAGPPFTATALTNGTPANTVTWYTGEMGTDSARGTAVAQVDDQLSVAYGVRANEQAIRSTVENIAVFAATSFSASDPNAADRFSALNQRLATALDNPPGQQKIQDIQSELTYAQTTMKSASERQQQRQTALDGLLDGIEGIPQEEVASQILALQTQLQASLQTTAMLYKMSIVNYLQAHRAGQHVRWRRRPRSRPAEQPGGKFAIDVDERAELLALRLGGERDRLVHHEQAEIGDVLADQRRQRMVGARHRGEEDRPELAVVEQRVTEVRFAASQPSLTACRRDAAFSRRSASSSRGLAVCLAIFP